MAKIHDEKMLADVIRRVSTGRRPFKTVDAAIRWAIENAPQRARAIDPAAVYTGDGGHAMEERIDRFTAILAAMARLDRHRWVALKMRAMGESYRAIESELAVRHGSAKMLVESGRDEVQGWLVVFGLMDEPEHERAAG